MDTLVLPAVLESLEAIGTYVLEAARLAGLDRKRAYHLRLAVDEVATNIITHGYEEAGGTGDITLLANQSDESLSVSLEDTAVPFDPRGRGEPVQLHEALDERPIGGLGVFIALKNVDGFEYCYADGRNRNTFIMRRQADEVPGEQVAAAVAGRTPDEHCAR